MAHEFEIVSYGETNFKIFMVNMFKQIRYMLIIQHIPLIVKQKYYQHMIT